MTDEWVPVEDEWVSVDEAKKDFTPGEELVGLGEAGLSIATGAAMQPIAGLAGIAAGVVPGGDTAAEAVEKWQGMGYQPRTRAGQQFTELAAVPFEKLDNLVTEWAWEESNGDPETATAIKTAVLAGPMALGVRRGGHRKAVENIENKLRQEGIDLSDPRIRQTIADAGAEKVGPAKGSRLDTLQDSVREAEVEARGVVDSAYEMARGTTASIHSSNMDELLGRISNKLDTYDIESMPTVQSRLKDFRGELELGDQISLSRIDDIRKRINNNMPQRGTPEAKALGDMKRELDSFMDDMFNRDMISGDPEALAAWKNARRESQKYKERFKDMKVIRDLVHMDATPEMVRNWLFNANSVGAKKEAALVVKKLKDILGKDHPQFDAIRAEYMFDIASPLLEAKPNLRMFVKKYDQSVRNNMSLIRELDMEAANDLQTLRRIAGAVEKTGVAPQFAIDIDHALSGLLFGHGIHRGGMKIKLSRKLLGRLRSATDDQRRVLLREMLGYDPNQPLMKKGTLSYGAVMSDQTMPLDEESIDNFLQ